MIHPSPKRFTPCSYPDHIEENIQQLQANGYLLPPRRVLRTPEQIEGIRESGRINTWLLDYLSEHIRADVSTAEIDRLAYAFTLSHGALPAPLHYEGFLGSICTSINEVVCHGIPSAREILRDGVILNVDVFTLYNGWTVRTEDDLPSAQWEHTLLITERGNEIITC